MGLPKRWKIALSVAAGIAALSVITIVLYYSNPINPCAQSSFRTVDNLLAPVTPKELYDGSELVVIGRITDSTAKCEGSQIWTYMQIEVEDSAKNPQGIKTLTGKAFGGTIGNYGSWLEDSPIFKKGDRAFLYLYKDNPSDTVYRVNPYSGVLVLNNTLPDEPLSASKILRSVRLQSVTTGNESVTDIPQGSSRKITLSLVPYFGYDSTTNVTIASFTYYNSTSDSFNTANVTALNDFGISVEPMHTIIVPQADGTKTEFRISAAERAVLGRYDIEFSADIESRYSYLAGGTPYTFVRINVTDDESYSDNVRAQILTSAGITFGTPYLVEISWNLSETTYGDGSDLSVSIRDNPTMKPLEQVTYDFGYKGVTELGGFQDWYVEDFSEPHKFRTGINNPCDMHLTIFINRVGDQSFASKEFDTSSVGIQFRTFPENELEGCQLDNIRLSLFNGYDPPRKPGTTKVA